MSSGTPPETTVLVADDEQHLADLYGDYLDDQYEVITAYGGEEAKERVETESIDVALLDRRMPDLSGDEVLAYINDEDVDCRVALVTAVNPDFDIIDMGCDEYIVKPVTQEELVEVVERLEKLADYSEKHQQLTSKKLKRNVLQVEKTSAELANSTRFDELESEIQRLESELDDISDELTIEDVQRHI